MSDGMKAADSRDNEYALSDAAHGLPGFSSNKLWDQPQEGGGWSHNPVHLAPKDGFHDPIAAGPDRQELWTDQNQPAAPDDNADWNVAYREQGGLVG